MNGTNNHENSNKIQTKTPKSILLGRFWVVGVRILVGFGSMGLMAVRGCAGGGSGGEMVVC